MILTWKVGSHDFSWFLTDEYHSSVHVAPLGWRTALSSHVLFHDPLQKRSSAERVATNLDKVGEHAATLTQSHVLCSQSTSICLQFVVLRKDLLTCKVLRLGQVASKP